MTNSSEKTGLDNAIRADFVRHGQTEYTGKPGDLTELGVEEIKQRAEEIAGEIDKDRECVVLWVSPTERTRATASIITDVLEKNGISIVKKSEVVTLRDTDKSETTMLEGAARLRPGLPESEIKSWIELLGPAKKDETPEEVSTRFGAVVEYMSRAAARVKPLNGKQIHFILVSHGYHPIIEVLKTAGVLNKDFITGSRAKMTIHKDSGIIDVGFHGWSGTVLFDRDKRQIGPSPRE